MLMKVLGGTRVIADSGVDVPLRSPERVILAVMQLRGPQPCSRDLLADALWGEGTPLGRREPVVRTYVSRLRRVLRAHDISGAIRTEPNEGYVLAVSSGETDLGRWKALRAAARRAEGERQLEDAADLLQKALAHWRGSHSRIPGLPDVPWVQQRADILVAERKQAEIDLVELRLQLGSAGPMIPWLIGRAGSDPLVEENWVQLMRTLIDAGRQTEAIETYLRARDHLAEELDVAPGPELRRLLKLARGQNAPWCGARRAPRQRLPHCSQPDQRCGREH
jgi:DNA-binding SARP family transcriptional activator